MRQEHRWRLVPMLILLIALGGCDTSRHSSRSSLSDNGRLMDQWSIYTHCLRSEDLEAMRADTRRLIRAIHMNNTAEGPSPLAPTVRLSADPAAMAAACALHTGQAAQVMGHLHVAREMFYLVVRSFPQPRYQYYVTQARLGLEQLDTVSRAAFNGLTM